ncbi:RDD family protein [Streptomyces sp. NPDC050704]|uniref:RDD family protein n=1 Tax=Streptomyces sp. NPDC050704 TaxID=3157219 RepID=UPI00343A06E6
MSAPTPAPGDDRPREGYYPDPSIPGYVRYWNGAAWVPGTSRPAPSDGASPSSPDGTPSAFVSTEETGPHFFDEDPPAAGQSPAEAQHGSRPEPAAAWGAERARQTGFGGDPDRRVSWGSPDPRVPSQSSQPDAQSAAPSQPSQPEGRSEHADGTATFRTPGSDEDSGSPQPPASGGTVVFRRPKGPVRPTGAPGAAGPEGATGGPGRAGAMGAGRAHVAGRSGAGAGRAGGPGAADASAGRTGAAAGGYADAAGAGRTDAVGGGTGPAGAGGPTGPDRSGVPGSREPLASEGTMTFRTVSPRAGQQRGAQPSSPSAQSSAAQAAAPAAPATPSGPTGPATSQQSTPGVPPQAGADAPMAAGAGGGQPSWAQQVHRLAGAENESEPPVVPWKPVREDPFQAAARAQSEARPAGLGKRLAARLVDTVVLAGVTGAAAVPLGTRALDHVNDKIDAAKLSGETVTVWLLDGTTAVYLGGILAVLVLFGVLYEAVPTAKWGRTLGKKLCGLQVRDIEGGEPPSFGSALRRWLVYSVPGVLVVGVVGVVWGLFDRPWRQCWHDKAAHTFVAG